MQQRARRSAQPLGDMRTSRQFTSMSAFALALFALSGCERDAPSDGPSLIITVLSGGSRCEVRKVEMDCGSVATYLRDTLRVPSDAYIAVAVPAHKPIHSESMHAVIEELQKAGFTTMIGLVPLPRSGS